jgi:spore maturation protein CgeB
VIPARLLAVILKHEYGDPARGDSYERVYFYGALSRMFAEARLFDFGPYLRRPEALQRDLLRETEAFSPDVIFFTLFEEQFAPATLDRLRERALTLNWFCDDQWRFRDFSRRYAPHFTWAVTTDRFAVEKYHAAGCPNVILSQWAAGDTLPGFDGDPGEVQHEVSFVGAADPYRAWVVRELARRGVEVACYGSGWPRGRLSHEGMADVFRRSRVNLNLSNSRSYDLRFALASWRNFRHFRTSPKNKEQIKGRHFEIGAWGGFQLTNYVEFLEDYFDIGREIAVHGALGDLADKIRFYLRHEELRRSIAAAGHRRIRREHTYDRRFEAIFRRLGLPGATP